MIHATLKFYPNQSNANGKRGVWRVLDCREINLRPYKSIYTVPSWGQKARVMRLVCHRIYKKGSRVDPRKMLGI